MMSYSVRLYLTDKILYALKEKKTSLGRNRMNTEVPQQLVVVKNIIIFVFTWVHWGKKTRTMSSYLVDEKLQLSPRMCKDGRNLW